MKIEYREDVHKELPHLICVSGGRTSGAMLLRLVESGELDAARGDVALFNNTSAEHPETYRFLRRLTKECEDAGLPFYWTEWMTFESYKETDGAKRHPTYRLCKPEPIEENPDGYYHRGEVFENMVSHKGFLPGRTRRICTNVLKALPSYGFIDDWLKQDDLIPRLGPNYNQTRMSIDRWHELNKRYRGKKTREDIERYKSFTTSMPFVRPAQRFSEFSLGKKRTEFSTGDFVSLVGIRADEKKRAERVLAAGKDNWPIAYTPFVEAGTKKQDVLDWWKTRPYDLGIGGEKSNCVGCFLKSSKNIEESFRDDPNDGTPASLSWWIDLEEKYMKRYEAPALDGTPEKYRYGFFGPSLEGDPNATTYRNFSKQGIEDDIPCMCLD